MSGSGVQMPKWKSYTLPSWEQPTIFREPSKSIHTRKKERVDMSDVTYMLRNDDSRINEGVAYLQRGINPHVDIMYNNAGGGGGGRLTTMSNVQASNPYKVMKDGAFRPPMFRQEDLLPLSRQRRSETSGITNPGIRSGYSIPNLVDNIDKTEIVNAIDVNKINYLSIRPTASYKIELPQEVFTSNAIVQDINNTSATSAVRGMNTVDGEFRSENPYEASKNANHYSVGTNLNVLIYDPLNKNYTEVMGSIKDKTNIAVQSSLNQPISLTREDGTPVKIKNYIWKTVQSAYGRDSLVLQLTNSPELELIRNTPLYAVGSNVSGMSGGVMTAAEIELARNTPMYAVGSNVSGHKNEERFGTVDPIMNELLTTSAGSGVSMRYGRNDSVHDVERNPTVRGMGSVGSISNIGSIPMVQSHNIPSYENNKNMQIKRNAREFVGDRYN